MFGGCSILLLGDFAQLPPVGDVPLFNLHPQVHGNPETVMASNKGRALYMSLTESIMLDHIMRQQGEDPPAVQFRQVLSNLQSMEATEPDRQFLNTRYVGNLSAEELAGFEDALHLCPTNALVDEINESKMSSSGKPVLTLPARNKGPEASNASDDDAEGLAEKLLLMEGAKVMLTRNIWTTKGLTNGSIGSIGTTFNSRNSLTLQRVSSLLHNKPHTKTFLQSSWLRCLATKAQHSGIKKMELELFLLSLSLQDGNLNLASNASVLNFLCVWLML